MSQGDCDEMTTESACKDCAHLHERKWRCHLNSHAERQKRGGEAVPRIWVIDVDGKATCNKWIDKCSHRWRPAKNDEAKAVCEWCLAIADRDGVILHEGD